MPPAHSTRTILVVEDEILIALAHQVTLRGNGYEVVTANTGERAVEIVCREQHVDLILMDIDLGTGIDGTQAAESILRSCEIPIVFLTGHAEQEMVEKVKGITRYGYVLKSSGEFVLMESIAMAFELFDAHRRAEQTRDHYKSIVRLSGEIVVRHGPKLEWVFVNQAACEFWGKSEDELLRDSYVAFVHPEDRAATRAVLEKMIETREPVRGFINRQQTPRGWRTVEWNSAPIIDEQANLVGYQAVGRDITVRRHAQALLERRESAHESILSNIADVVAIIDADGVNRFKSPNVQREFGWKPEELVGRNTFENVHPGDLAEVREMFMMILAAPNARSSGKCRYRRADGTYRWIAFIAVNKLDDPSVEGVLLSYRDIEDEQRARQHLETTLSQLRTTFESAPTGIILADSRNRIVDANPTASMLFGYSREELIGLYGYDLIHPDDLAGMPIGGVTQAAETGNTPISIENRFRRKDGSYFHAGVWVGAFRVPGYDATHIVQFQDIGDRVAARRRIQDLLEQKEILLKEAHHRIKNDLHLIHSLLDLQAATSANAEIKRALGEASDRIALIGQVYQNFEGSNEFLEVDAVTVVSAIVRKAQCSLERGRILVQTGTPRMSVPVRLSVSLGIVVNELVTNAVKYAFEGEPDAARRRPEISVTIERDADGVLSAAVADNGRGFEDQVIQGTGRSYGLTIVEALVTQHNGTLGLRNEGGAVASFRLHA